MSIEVDVLSETYTILKQYIPQKDRQEAADNLMSVMVDMLTDEQLRDFGSVDSFLSRALKEYVVEEEDEYQDEDE
jgi:uncharacterized protein YqeY